MNSKLILTVIAYLLLVCDAATVFAQNTDFIKGHYIDKEGIQRDGYFLFDQVYTPDFFTFKSDLDEDLSVDLNTSSVYSVKLEDGREYVAETVNIDIFYNLSEDKNRLPESSNPNYRSAHLFLQKVYDSSEVSLYRRKAKYYDRFLIQRQNREIIQLVNKRYYKLTEIKINDEYKKQLKEEFKCDVFTNKTYEELEYTEKDLLAFVKRYSKCAETNLSASTTTTEDDYSSFFEEADALEYEYVKEIIIKDRLSYGPLVGYDAIDLIHTDKSEPTSSIVLGAQLEYLTTLLNNKLSVFIQPKYYGSTVSYSGIYRDYTYRYQVLSFPFGAKYQFYNINKAKVYVSAAFIGFMLSQNSRLIKEGGLNDIIDLKPNASLDLGVGVKYSLVEVGLHYLTKRQTFDQNYETKAYGAFVALHF